MNLIKFIWNTDALLAVVPAATIVGTVQQFAEKEQYTPWFVLLIGTILTMLCVIKKAQHRRTLDRSNMVALVREMIHNANTLPFTLPQEDVALAKVDELFDNPLK